MNSLSIPLSAFIAGFLVGCNVVEVDDRPRSTTLTSTSRLVSTNDCPNGGVLLDYGLDTNGDGVLAENETIDTLPICHGRDGEKGPGGADATAPVGAVVAFAGPQPPDGWLLCDGSEVSRDTYADLFSTIGVAYGVGDSVSTFTLPDLRGRFPFGKADMGGSPVEHLLQDTAHELGVEGGEETVKLTENELPNHTHGLRLQERKAAVGPGAYTAPLGNGSGDELESAAQGSGEPHNNMPPFLTLNYIIRH